MRRAHKMMTSHRSAWKKQTTMAERGRIDLSVMRTSAEKKQLAALKAKEYRNRKKNDPEYKKKERDRKRCQRQQPKSEEQIVREREKNKIRQAKYRERKRRKYLEDQTLNTTETVKKRLTRAEHEKRKAQWRASKQKSRRNQSAQKKRRIREYDRNRKMALRKKGETNTLGFQASGSSETHSSLSLSSPTTSSVKQKAYRVKKQMPHSPGKFAQVIGHMVKNATPRKREALKEIGLSSTGMQSKRKLEIYTGCLKKSVDPLKTKRQHHCNVAKRILAYTLKSVRKAKIYKMMSKDMGIGYKHLRKYTCEDKDVSDLFNRKKRKDAVPPETVQKVVQFFNNSATHVPDTKAVNRRTLESKKVLEEPVSKLYDSFKETHPESGVSRSIFHKLRPKNVQTTRSKRLYQNLCEYCTNAKLKLDVLNKLCDKKNVPQCKIDGKDDLVHITHCPKQPNAEHRQKQCINRTCNDCSVNQLDSHFHDLVTCTNENEDLTWTFWTTKQFHSEGKAKTSTRKVVDTKVGSIHTLLADLKKNAVDLSSHLFVADWQKREFDTLSKAPPANSVVMHLDFSENYSTFHQQEVSSAHWMKNLITVHPLVAFYMCPSCQDGCSPVMDVLVFLSDDNQHDCHAVHHFVSRSVQFLMEERGITFTEIHQFTDGCAAQYKSRGPFVDLSFALEDFGVRIERNFFGSCHGKGPSDAAGGVTKTAARMAVIRGQAIITDAKSMYSYLKAKFSRGMKIKNICNHSRREYFLVENINRNRPERMIKTTLKGTRKIHSVRGISPGIVCTRNLSCHCKGCQADKNCANSEYVDGWDVRRMNTIIPQTQRAARRGGGRGTRERGGGRGTRERGRGHGRGKGRGRGRGLGRGNRGAATRSETGSSSETDDDDLQGQQSDDEQSFRGHGRDRKWGRGKSRAATSSEAGSSSDDDHGDDDRQGPETEVKETDCEEDLSPVIGSQTSLLWNLDLSNFLVSEPDVSYILQWGESDIVAHGDDMDTVTTEGKEVISVNTDWEMDTVNIEGKKIGAVNTDGKEKDDFNTEGKEMVDVNTEWKETDTVNTDWEMDTVNTEGKEMDIVNTEGKEIDIVNAEGKEMDTVNTDGKEKDDFNTEGKEMVDVNTEGKETDTVNTDWEMDTVNTEGKEMDTVNTEGKEMDTVNTDGKDMVDVSTEGKEMDTVNTEGKETDTVNTEGKEMVDVNTEGKETDTVNTEGKEADTVNTEGKEADTVNTEGKETDTVNTDGKETDTVNTDGKEMDAFNTERKEMAIGEPQRYIIGTYVAINNGKQILPAVVTSLDPLGVRYFLPKGRGKTYSPDEEPYYIENRDIQSIISDPKIQVVGSRLYYQFEDFLKF